nr:zonadhesin-like 2 [Yponomeuta cagnagella]
MCHRRSVLFLVLILAYTQFGAGNPSSEAKANPNCTKKPPTPKCGPNEKFIENKVSCPGDSCILNYVAIDCIANQTSSPGCVCNDGYLRNASGFCIPSDQCLPLECVNDPNAVSGCGNRCGKTCKDYKNKRKVCSLACQINGCDCRKDYVYDENVQLCVKPRNCTKQCYGANEVYTNCIYSDCSTPKTCDQVGYPSKILCPRYPRGGCPSGCICKEGFARDSSGKCIDINQCRDYSCPANSTYVSCNVKCPNDYCPEDDQPQPMCDAPQFCDGGCRCKLNYRLNKDDQCIVSTECPPIDCTRPNEVFDSCPSACLAERCEDRDSQPSTCNTLVLNCQPQCVCEKNYWRNKDGICVTPKECSVEDTDDDYLA